MNKLKTQLFHRIHLFNKWDFLVFTLLTILAVLNEQTTVFYLIYLFWWNELICLVIDRICYKKNPNAVLNTEKQGSMFAPLLIMGVYFVFIVVVFGLIANWDNKVITIVNLEILFFKNWFFNLNLIFMLLERIYLHKSKQGIQVSFGHFTANMIILHISIVLGALFMFFIVKNYPQIFTPQNLWGSVIIVLPFLMLKAFFVYLSKRVK